MTSAGEPVAAPARRRRKLPPPSMIVAGLMLAAVLLMVAIVPFTPGYDPYKQDLFIGMTRPLETVDGRLYLLGTDSLGRDLLSRLALAGQVSIVIAVSAVLISLMIGITLGLTAGFFGGWIEAAIMGLADLQLSIPRVLLLIAVAAIVGSSVFNLTLLLGLTSWVAYGRVARAMALSLREREFVLSATTQGAGPLWNIRKHLLPHVMSPLLIVGSFELGQVILLEASLSYLGLGIQPPLPSWGLMIAEGQQYLQTDPIISIAPGIAIFMLVAGIQFLSQRFTSEGNQDLEMMSKVTT